jgi:WD40 repeat protein
MANTGIETTITGGQIQGVAGAGTVVIENFTIYNRAVEEPAVTDAAGEPFAPCPYPGLAYFGPGDTDLFFGRDAAITRLAEAVSCQSLTALVGASGSGKSSVVLAGLAPRLHAAGGWRFSHFRIGTELESNPFLALARALVPLYVASDSDTERLRNTRQLATSLQTGELTLRDVFADCRSRNKGTRILLIADQFEEAFTLVEDEALLHRFIDVLLAGFPDPLPGGTHDICLILTLRADFYGRALRHRPLADALQGHIENLGPMNREELQAAIHHPADGAKVSFEPGLVETLLDDVENKPSSLPLLQFALREMWGRQHNRKITRKSYDEIGGVEGALAQRAETIFAAMTENGANQQMTRAFQRLFTRLVTLGEGQEDTRRVVERRELGDDIWSLAQRLAGETNRLVVTNAPAFSRETAEVAHEALIRHWPKLIDWINRDRAFQSWLRQIRPNVELWSADPTDDGPLLRGGMLAQARDWLARRRDDLSPAEHDYIEASLALQRRAEEEREAARQAEITRQQELAEAAVKLAREQRRRAGIAMIGVVVALVLAILAGGAGFYAYRNGQRAEGERDKARSQLLASEARRSATEGASADDIERAGALALASITKSREIARPPEADAIEAAGTSLSLLPLEVLSHGSPVRSLAALPDGRLASVGDDEDGTIKLWSKEGRGGPEQFFLHGRPVWSLAALPDGRLASAGRDQNGTIKVWPKEGRGGPELVLSHGSPVRSLIVLADGRLASGADDRNGTIKIWPKDGTNAPENVLFHGSGFRSLAELADGRLASGGEDNSGTIKLWSEEGRGGPEQALLHGRPVWSLVALPDGRLVSGGSGDATELKVWAKGGRSGAEQILLQSYSALSLVVMADGRLAAGDQGHRIKLWPTNDERKDEPAQILSQGSEVWSLAVLRDGRLASGGKDGAIKIWPKQGQGEPEQVLTHGSERAVWFLAVLEDGRLASGDGNTIKIWPKDGRGEPESGGKVGFNILPPNRHVLPDGRMASGGQDGVITIWPKERSGRPWRAFSHGSPVKSLTVLADGQLVSGGEDGTIKFWTKDGQNAPERVLSQGSVAVWSLAVLADGRLASGGSDGKIKLWPKEWQGEPVVISQPFSVTSLAVLKIRLWLVDEQQLIATLCLRAGRNFTKDEWTRYIGTDTPWQPSCRDLPSNWRTPD